MSMEFSITLTELLIALVLATIVYLLESVLFARRRRKSVEAEEIEALKAQLAGLSRRLEAVEANVGETSTDTGETGRAAYDYAVQYARQGMIAPEIAARCGISRDEAALIVAMQGRRTES